MCELVNHDHLQELSRGFLEQGGHANLIACLELAALHSGYFGVQPKRAMGQVQAIIEEHLPDGRRIAQVILLERQRVGVKSLVAFI